MTSNFTTNGKRIGRPPISPDDDGRGFDQSLGDMFIQRIYAGDPIHKAAEYCGISISVIGRWRIDHLFFNEAFERAQAAQHDKLGDTLLTAHEDIDDPQRAKLYSDNVKWLLSKRDRRYSDKLELSVETKVSLADALKEAQGRVIPGSYQVMPDVTPSRVDSGLSSHRATDSQSDSDPDELADLLS